jgi:hypothetical protein
MQKKRYLYNLRVRPSIFSDGTFGIYAIPQTNDAVEYQLIGQLDTEEEAIELAKKFMTDYKNTFRTKDVEVITDRDTRLETLVAGRTKEKQEDVLREHLKIQFKAPGTLKFRPFDRITNTTPHLLSFFALVVFSFSISFSVPTWIPILGDWIGGRVLALSDFAKFYPFIILFCTIYVQVRARRIGFQLAGIRDYVLILSIEHGWRIEQFLELFLDVLDTSPYSWTRKLGEWLAERDPDSFSKSIKDIGEKLADAPDQEVKNQNQDLSEFLLLEDFEARIHALYYMDKEKNYRPWAVVLYPIFFLINISRARRRLRHLKRSGFGGILFDAVWSLPGEGEYKVHRKLFPFIATYEFLIIAGPILWAFTKSPWEGFIGWIGMGILILLSMLPMLIWNYQLMVQHRGLPRSMAFEEIQGDQKLIRAM